MSEQTAAAGEAPSAAAIEMVKDGVMGVAETAALAGVSRSCVYGLMDRGELPFTRIGDRRLIPRKFVVELLARGLVLPRAA